MIASNCFFCHSVLERGDYIVLPYSLLFGPVVSCRVCLEMESRSAEQREADQRERLRREWCILAPLREARAAALRTSMAETAAAADHVFAEVGL